MGCGSSTESEVAALNTYSSRQQYNQKPVANVHPQQQQGGYTVQVQQTIIPPPQPSPVKQTTPSAPPPQPQPPPQQKQQQPPAPPVVEQKGETITMEMLKRYIELEMEIRELEKANIVGNLQMKNEQMDDIKKTAAELEVHYKKACQKVAKEKADVDKMKEPSVREIFANQEKFDEEMSKEQEEYLEAVGEQEVLKKQLDGVKDQSIGLYPQIRELSEKVEHLKTIYDEQDELLDKIFSGEYGSDLENKLEHEVDQLLDKKERVGVAKNKWANARVLLDHACNQLAFAVKRWTDLNSVHPSNIQQRYQIATETRNNLIAACQNITSAQRYLASITFPYCQPPEIETLDRACKNIYIDLQTAERQKHALQCYSVTHSRASALLQWFDSVINKTIKKDLDTATKELAAKEKLLRLERLKLIKARVGSELGNDPIFNSILKELQADVKDTKGGGDDVTGNVGVSEPDQVTGAEGLSQGEGGDQDGVKAGNGQAPAPKPLPLNELAPTPSNEALFGNIEQLRKQHEQEMKEFEKAQETNKARMEQGLQDKLKRRRSRRQRLEEKENIMSEPLEAQPAAVPEAV